MAYVSNLLKRRRRFLDVGANIVILFILKIVLKYQPEPLKEISYRLEYFQNGYLKVHNCALSNKKVSLNIYTLPTGMSSSYLHLWKKKW